MNNAGLSSRNIAGQFRVNQSIIVRLLQRYRADGTVSERQRSGRPRKTDERENRYLKRLARANPTLTARRLRDQWPVHGPISVRTVTRTLNRGGVKARRPIKRPQLTPRHKRARFDWACDHLHWNIRSWRRVHWSDECKFVLRHVDGRMRVWREDDTAYEDRNIVGTTAFGGGSVTVWACFSYGCKLDLYVLDGTLTGVKYRDNVIMDIVVPHFDNHRLVDRPIFMDDNARPHRAAIVRDYLQQEAIDMLHGRRCRPT